MLRARPFAHCELEGSHRLTYVIAEPCIGVKDNSCVEVCPVDCIHSDDASDMFYIDPDECIDCGVCAEVCPVEAIFFEDDLPERWSKFLGLNSEYFQNR
jgi:NAD-dependent dihydropyrimidine dehydrogenase PreA subunit